jgi:hypothetical protein
MDFLQERGKWKIPSNQDLGEEGVKIGCLIAANNNVHVGD